ncbi:MAG: hypothetical protein IPL61_33845 [Myxococcales bacterium]|nr:hypothetical protein [Myxococcales bacterium]
MLAELIARVAASDLKPLAEQLARELAARGEVVAVTALEAHLRELVAAAPGAPSFLSAVEHRVHALAAALEADLGRTPTPATPARGAITPATPARGAITPATPARGAITPATSPPSPAPAGACPPPPPIQVAALRALVKGVPGVTVGAPRIDRALLDGRGPRTYVWLEGAQLLAIGPATAAVAAACAPEVVATPAWLPSWRALTELGRNPWRSPDDADLDALVGVALDRTADATPREPYRSDRPRQAFKAALADWARAEIQSLGTRMAATVDGEVTPIRDGAARDTLVALAGRSASLSAGALVPLLLADMAGGPLVQVAPTPAGVDLDVIGRAAAGCVRVRVVRLAGGPTSFRGIVLPRAPRGATTVEGGDVLVTLFGP